MARLQISAEFIRSSTATVFQPISTADYDPTPTPLIRTPRSTLERNFAERSNPSDGSGAVAGHRKTRVQGFSANEPFRLQNLSIILNYRAQKHRGRSVARNVERLFQPVKGEVCGTMAASIPEEARGKGSKAYRCRRRSFNLKPT